MPRTTLLWTLVVFFGASIAFRVVLNATEDEPTAVRIALQLPVLALILVAIVLFVRRSDRG